MKTRYNPNMEYKNGNKGAWFIMPKCDCFGLYLQSVDTGEASCGAFTWDGNAEEPTFMASVYPRHCPEYTKNKQRCHFFVLKGVANHCVDSAYANEKRPLRQIDER